MFPEIGQDKSAPYVAFGDDSKYEDVLVYGFFICKREDLDKIERGITSLKRKFGIPEHIPLHLKDLLNGIYREKNRITKFEPNRKAAYFKAVVDLINKHKCIIRYSFAIIPENGKLLRENKEDEQIPIVEDHKAILHQMAAMCFTPYIEGGQVVFTVKDFEVYLSSDKTKVKFAENSPKKQAHFMSEVIIPTTNPHVDGTYMRLKPNIVLAKENIFLQFADSVAYMVSHALSKRAPDDLYKNQLKRIKYFINHELVAEND